MDKLRYVLVAVAVALIVAAGLSWWQRRAPPAEPVAPPVATAPAPPPAPAEPAIKHPVPAPADPASAAPLPPLDKADAAVNAALTELLGRKAVLSLLQTDHFAQRAVATVDGLARPHAAPRLWPVNPMPGRFGVAQRGDATEIDADNALRYAKWVQWIESIDAARAADLYYRLYPLFQQAYEELGYPRRHFNDRLVEVIDHLLATPPASAATAVRLTEVKGPIATTRPWVRYEFADPALESLSSGQKIMLRVGPENQRRLKAKLAEFRRHVATGQPSR